MKKHVLPMVVMTGLTLSAQAVEPPVEKPNVIIVLTDDQGYGDLSCHGNPVLKTPQLDRLHAESVRFTDFHAAPMCTSTRGQLMTGQPLFPRPSVRPPSLATALTSKANP